MTNKEAIKLFRFYQGEIICDKEMKEALDLAIKALEERPRGKWMYDNTINNWKCSECGETPKTIGYVGTAKFMNDEFKFCNHCGAKMTQDEEEENE